MRGRLRRWTDAQFIAAVEAHTNFTDVIRALGLRPAGGNHRTMKRHAVRLGVDLSHFSGERRVRGLRLAHDRARLDPAAIFQRDSRVAKASVRRYAIGRLVPFACATCGNTGEWRGLPLTLQLHHVNGVYDDHRLENLRWLCPNCHSQTESFAGKGTAVGLRALRAPSASPPTL